MQRSASRDGLIVDHVDSFDFHRWAGQALGPSGRLLGGTSFLRTPSSAGPGLGSTVRRRVRSPGVIARLGPGRVGSRSGGSHALRTHPAGAGCQRRARSSRPSSLRSRSAAVLFVVYFGLANLPVGAAPQQAAGYFGIRLIPFGLCLMLIGFAQTLALVVADALATAARPARSGPGRRSACRPWPSCSGRSPACPRRRPGSAPWSPCWAPSCSSAREPRPAPCPEPDGPPASLARCPPI